MKHNPRANRCSACWMFLLALMLCGVSTLASAGGLEDAKPKAVQILLNASRSEDALLRMHAVEASRSMPHRALPMVQLALGDENPAVRFAALVTAGRLELEAIGGQALRISNDPQQPNYVQAAAIFAAYRCGQEAEADLGQLAEMLWDSDAQQRSNAAMLLGLTGQSSAAAVLIDAGQAPMHRSRPIDRELVRLQITEALLNLGNEDSLKTLRGLAYSDHDEVRVLAVLMLGRAGDGGMEGNLIGFLAKDPVELRLASAEALARIGSLEGVPVMLHAAELPQATVRSQAAFALGQAHDSPLAAAALIALLGDPEPRVRIAAAAATLEALNP